MINQIFDYRLLETSVTIMFLLVALTAIILTFYFFVLQKVETRKRMAHAAVVDPKVGRYFERINDLPVTKDDGTP